MELSSAVLLKGLAGAGAISVAATGIVYRKEIYETFAGKTSLLEKLNLPNTCSMPTTNSTPTTCDLNASQLSGVKFLNSESDWTTENSSAQVSLKITTSDASKNLPEHLKFVFTANKDVRIKKGTTTKIKLKESVETEFKLISNDKGYFLEENFIIPAEKELGITCDGVDGSGITCQVSNNQQLGSLTNASSSTISVVKNTEEDHTIFTNGISYKMSGSSDNGNYKIEKDTENSGKNFKLTKVNDLTLQQLCAKVGLTCSEGSCTTACTIPTADVGWTSSFYVDAQNYVKQSKITGISSVAITTDSSSNSQYYGGHKFVFTISNGAVTFEDQKKTGTVSVVASKGYQAKYFDDIKSYAFFKVES